MKKTTSVSPTVLWRFAPFAVSIVLLVDYYMRVIGFPCFQGVLITPERFFIPVIITSIIAIATVFFPYQFYFHAMFCLSLGLLQLIDGEMTNALAVYFFGYIFLYRQGFFRSWKWPKLFIGILLIAIAVVSQSRLPHIDILPRLIQFADVPIILFLVAIILRPEIQAIQEKKRGMTLTLRQDLFTEKDAVILKKILAGNKYEAIAKAEGMVLSTFKKHTRRLFDILRVNDRITFMALYANHQIIIGNDDKAQKDAQNGS
ncbi:MAG: hypothetical protein FWB78_08410 [Treponema sp.]|nr:hypothetical protein [Treponema sp.]